MVAEAYLGGYMGYCKTMFLLLVVSIMGLGCSTSKSPSSADALLLKCENAYRDTFDACTTVDADCHIRSKNAWCACIKQDLSNDAKLMAECAPKC